MSGALRPSVGDAAGSVFDTAQTPRGDPAATGECTPHVPFGSEPRGRRPREDGSSRRSVMSTLCGRHAERACYFRPAVWLTLLFIASRAIIWLYLIDRGSDLARQKGFVQKIVDG